MIAGVIKVYFSQKYINLLKTDQFDEIHLNDAICTMEKTIINVMEIDQSDENPYI